jgi:hypothetical protein
MKGTGIGWESIDEYFNYSCKVSTDDDSKKEFINVLLLYYFKYSIIDIKMYIIVL